MSQDPWCFVPQCCKMIVRPMAAVNFRTDWEEETPMCRCSVICSMMLMGMSMRSTSGEACLVMQTQEKISHTSMMNSLEELPLRRSLAQPTFLPILDGSGSDRHHSPITVFMAGISGCQTTILHSSFPISLKISALNISGKARQISEFCLQLSPPLL